MNKVEKIDMHVHLNEYGQMYRYGTTSTYCTPEQLLKMYEELGIKHGVVLPEVNPECGVDVQSVGEVYRIVEKYPDKFSYFCNIDPRALANSPGADISYMLAYHKARGAKGVGEICANMYFDDPRVMNLFAHCEKCEMPVIFHMTLRNGEDYGLIDDLGLPRLEKCLKTFPNLKILGHSAAFWAHISTDVTFENSGSYPSGKVCEGRVVELMRKYPNMCGDLSAGSGFNALTRDPEYGCKFLEEFSDRLYFATDICAPENEMLLSHWLDDMCEQGKISREAYEKISYKNAEKLLGI